MSNRSVIIIQLFQDRIVLKEYKGDKGSTSPQKAELFISHDAQYKESAETARKIAELIKAEGIKTTNVVIVPQAAEILVRNITIPPLSDMSMLKGVVTSRLDREMKISAGEMTLDYCGEISGQKQNHILLAGLQSKKDAILQNICEGAGLNLIAIVPEFVWLYKNQIKPGTSENIIYLTDSNATIATVTLGHISSISSFSLKSSDIDTTANRISAEILRNPNLINNEVRKFKVISSQSNLADLLNQKAIATFSFFPSTDPFTDYTDAIAGIYLSGKEYEINFEHNHFTGKRKNQLSANSRKLIIAALAVLALVAWFFIDWSNDKNQIANDQLFIDGIKAQVDASKAIIDKISQARKWSNTESQYSQCLEAISRAFPDADSIWTNSLAINEDFTGIITGSSISSTSIENMIVSFGNDPHFSEVKTLYIREAGANSSEISFAMQFRYDFDITDKLNTSSIDTDTGDSSNLSSAE